MSLPRKKCKGINKAKLFKGCDEFKNIVYAGLCSKCLSEWLYSTGEGKDYLNRNLIPKAKKTVAKKEKVKTKIAYEKLETKTDVEKKLQKEINKLVRILDKGHYCISSGRSLGKNYDAGHLYSVGSNAQIRFHLFNIFAQSVHDNQYKSGNGLEYAERLKELFGEEVQLYCLSLKGYPSINLEKHEIKEKTTIARRIVKWLELQDRRFSLKERIELREKFNKEIGIYTN